MSLTVPTGQLSPDHCIIYLTIWRIVLGIGVGGDYPMSASVTSDRAKLRKRGTMLAYIFSNQGWGSLVGSLLTIIVLLCYKHVMNDEGKTSKVDGVWRICIGFSLIPALGTLYQRLTLPESTRYSEQKAKAEGGFDSVEDVEKKDPGATAEVAQAGEEHSGHFMEFLRYMSEWRHFKILLATAGCWFLLDIAYVIVIIFSTSIGGTY